MTKMIENSMLIQAFKQRKKIKFPILHNTFCGVRILDNALLIQALSKKEKKA